MRRSSALAVLLVAMLACLSVSVAAAGEKQNFAGHLSGDQVVPPVETLAQGEVAFKTRADGVDVKLTVAGVVNVTQAHVHLGSEGEQGPIVVWLYSWKYDRAGFIPGRFSGVAADRTITTAKFADGSPLDGHPVSDLIDAIAAGNVYVDVHMDTDEDEIDDVGIRGQVG